MKKTFSKGLSFTVSTALILAMLSACSSNSEQSSSDAASSAAETAQTESVSTAESDSEVETQTVTAKVTSVSGTAITAETGTITESSGDAPEMPDGEGGDAPDKPDGEGGDAPDKPDGESGDAPDKPDGESGDAPEMPDGEGGGMGQSGKTFESDGGSVTFEVTDDTAIIVEFLQGSGEGTIDDIAEGSVIEAEIDDDGNAISVTVKNLNAGSGFGGSSEVTNGTSANTIDTDAEISGESYSSDGDDENALRIDGVTAVLDGITADKSGGDSSNTENGDFYGQNAVILALNGAEVTITNATVTSSAVNGNGVFSYGEGTVVNISDSTIRTTERNSGGIQTTGGGTTNASNLDVETDGASSAAIRSDRGGGTVNVDGGTYVTNGTGSPAVYCTADITVQNAQLTANASEAVVVEGRNSVTLIDCDVVGSMEGTYNDSEENIHGIMIYQSMSGDADIGEAYFSAQGGSITTLVGDMFYITNTSCKIDLSGVSFTLANDAFLRIEGNSSSRGWGTQGANGGDVVLTAEGQSIEGNIYVDDISSLDMTLSGGSALVGAINPDGQAGEVSVTLDETSTWTLTADSYVTSFDGDISAVTANGFHLYVNGEQVV